MNRKRHLAVGLILVVALVGAACSEDAPTSSSSTSKDTPSSQPTTSAPVATTSTSRPSTTTTAPTTTTLAAQPGLVVWADDEHGDAIERIGRTFTSDTGVEVTVVRKDFATIRDDVIQAEPGEGPDIFVGSHEWTGTLTNARVVAPIDDLPEWRKDNFFESTFSGFIVDGVPFGLPYEIEAIAVWMNTTLAEQSVGPLDFEEVRTMCDLVIDDNRGQICFALSGGGDSSDAYHQFPFTSALGGTIFRFDPSIGYRATTAGIDSAESIAGNKLMEALAIEEYMPSLDYAAAEEAFTTGRAMFWMTGPWAQDVVDAGSSDSGFRYTVVPIPLMEGKAAKPFTAARGFFIGGDTELASEARQFLYRYLATSSGMKALHSPGSLPTHRVVAGSMEDPLHTVFLESAVAGQPTPNLPEMTPEVWMIWGDALRAIRNGTAGVETALSRAAQQINDLLHSENRPP